MYYLANKAGMIYLMNYFKYKGYLSISVFIQMVLNLKLFV